MTLAAPHAPALTWTEPAGIAPRGTVVVIPGRGEQPELYERFGRRIASDGYRVHVVTDPAEDEAAATAQIAEALSGEPLSGEPLSEGALSEASRSGVARSGAARSGAARSGAALSEASRSGVARSGVARSGGALSEASRSGVSRSGVARSEAARSGVAPSPHVLAGSDTGALFAVALAVSGALPGIDALILAGLPGPVPAPGPPPAAAPPGSAAGPATGSWDAELDARTACPTHRGRLAGPHLRRGALYEPVPAGWLDRADLSLVSQPVLGLHGADDPLSPLGAARARYAAAPRAELVSIAGGRHDAFNDQTHRTAAASVVLFLERLRLDPDRLTAIAVRENLDRADA